MKVETHASPEHEWGGKGVDMPALRSTLVYSSIKNAALTGGSRIPTLANEELNGANARYSRKSNYRLI